MCIFISMSGPPYKYHEILRKIYETFGTEFNTFRELATAINFGDSVDHIRSKMNDMSWSYAVGNVGGTNRKRKKYLIKTPWSEDIRATPTRWQKQSFFWKVTPEGIAELIKVYPDIEVYSQDNPIVAKLLLEDDE